MAKSSIKICPNEKAEAPQGCRKVDLSAPIEVKGKKFHFIGAGGVGMSGLAKLLLKNNAVITGSDQAASHIIQQLCQLGANIKIGHLRENLDEDIEAVVVSAAITEYNPELQMACKRGCKVYKYAQMLGLLMNRYEGVAIAGTHGKSTTTGWLVYILNCAGLNPNFIVGADILQLGTSSGTGTGDYFVAEACEYDRSFLNLKPKLAAILNIEQDHLDYYRDENEIVEAFNQFAGGIRDDGVLIANGHDPNVAKIIRGCRFGGDSSSIRCETFGLDESCNFSAQNISAEDGLYSFDVFRDGNLLGRAHISLPGRHNILNALVVVAGAVNIGLKPNEVLKLLPEFSGIDRRLMLKAQINGITILDDYAHHPTEIKASLDAIRQRYRPKRLWCVFQPHQYSRTRFLLDDFAESFKLADIIIVPEIYFVRDTEQSKHEVNSKKLVERICSNGAKALFIDDFDSICDYLKKNVAHDDLIVTMGAGNVWKIADEYIQWLRRNC